MNLLLNMTYMELSTVPIYMDEFVGACFIPPYRYKYVPDCNGRGSELLMNFSNFYIEIMNI